MIHHYKKKKNRSHISNYLDHESRNFAIDFFFFFGNDGSFFKGLAVWNRIPYLLRIVIRLS